MSIDLVRIRAAIHIGSLSAGTPPLGYKNHILSFNVDKVRGQVSTFSASLKVHKDEISGGILNNASVQIYAGEGSPRNLIFTGIIRTANINPYRDDPNFVVLNIGGNDVLSRLQGKKYTRRCRSIKGMWVSIDSVAREGLRSGKFMPVAGKPILTPFNGALSEDSTLTQARTAVALDIKKAPSNSPDKKEVVMDVIPYGP